MSVDANDLDIQSITYKKDTYISLKCININI